MHQRVRRVAADLRRRGGTGAAEKEPAQRSGELTGRGHGAKELLEQQAERRHVRQVALERRAAERLAHHPDDVGRESLVRRLGAEERQCVQGGADQRRGVLHQEHCLVLFGLLRVANRKPPHPGGGAARDVPLKTARRIDEQPNRLDRIESTTLSNPRPLCTAS